MLGAKPLNLFGCLFIASSEFAKISCSTRNSSDSAFFRPKHDRKLSLLGYKKSPIGVDLVLTPPPIRNDQSFSTITEDALMNANDEVLSDSGYFIYPINMGPATVRDESYMHQAAVEREESKKIASDKFENEKQTYFNDWNNNPPKHSRQSQQPRTLTKKNNLLKVPPVSQRGLSDVRPFLEWSPITVQSNPSPVPSTCSEISTSKKVWRRKDGCEDYDIGGGFPGSEEPFSDDENYELVSVESDSSDEFSSSEEEELIILPSGDVCYKPTNDPVLAEKIRTDDFYASYHSSPESLIFGTLVGSNSDSDLEEIISDMKKATLIA